MTTQTLTARDFWTGAYRTSLHAAAGSEPGAADAYAHTNADTLTIRGYGFTRTQLDALYRDETQKGC